MRAASAAGAGALGFEEEPDLGAAQGADRGAVRVHPSLRGGHGVLDLFGGRSGLSTDDHRARVGVRANEFPVASREWWRGNGNRPSCQSGRLTRIRTPTLLAFGTISP